MRNAKFKSLMWTGILFLLISCATPRVVTPPVNRQEKLEKNKAAGTELSHQLDPQIQFADISDPKVRAFLAKTAKRLYNAAPQFPIPAPTPVAKPSPVPSPTPLAQEDVQVRLIQDRTGKWVNYALPGVRLYLSHPLLKKLDHENELAAAMAFPMGHVAAEQGFKYMREHGDPATSGTVKVDFFGEDGFFNYSDDSVLEAADAAFNMVYQAGYDPRGFLSLWNLYLKNPKESPYSAELLEKLIENARRNIALQAPLRNPIVRSEAFLEIRQRILKR